MSQPDTSSLVAVNSGHSSEEAIRLHDMDSLRAAMMLLGIVFHVAWFFIPVYFGHTLSDVGGSWGFYYFFGWVHQFRMQVFFLIAGFFACLLMEKRGIWSFLKNRWMRVAVPFMASMLILFPVMKIQYIRGGNLSGRILSDEPISSQFLTQLAAIDWWQEWPVHLWFLECLLILYSIAITLRLLADNVFDRRGRLRARVAAATNRLTLSHVGPFVLAIPVAACMAYDLTWLGIESGPLNPNWLGVLAYWFFFAIGWCLYRQPQLIDCFVYRWPIYLVVGSLMSLVLCGYTKDLLTSQRWSYFYPALTDSELNYDSMRPKLLAAANSYDSNGPADVTAYGVVWELLSPRYQRFVKDQPHPSSDALAGLAWELTEVCVFNPEFDGLILAAGRKTRRTGTTDTSDGSTPAESAVTNRELLAATFPGEFKPFWKPPAVVRGSYFYGYALASWLMTFSMLGLFRRYLKTPNRYIRYFAESSYWLYLIHLPLQFEITLWLAQWEFNGLVKFVIYNVLTFAILIPTYHYLVRPTWLGQLLNGRRYPSPSLIAPSPESRSFQ